jgi:two-component sensor histidine kinase
MLLDIVTRKLVFGLYPVDLSTTDEGQGLLVVRDDGPGILADTGRRGMGSRLIAGFVAQLGGEYSLTNDRGTVFTMTFPLNA